MRLHRRSRCPRWTDHTLFESTDSAWSNSELAWHTGLVSGFNAYFSKMALASWRPPRPANPLLPVRAWHPFSHAGLRGWRATPGQRHSAAAERAPRAERGCSARRGFSAAIRCDGQALRTIAASLVAVRAAWA